MDDLKAIDTQLYENLMQVKYFDGDVESLGLTMTVAQDIFGASHETNLVPNGANVSVSNENRLLYITLYANWLLTGRIREHVSFFVRGMRSVFDEEYFSIFFPDEIEMLISGGKSEIDIDDLQRSVRYDNWNFNDQAQKEYMMHFWSIVRGMPNEQKEKLLMFATGSERSPLLGFRFLSTPFTISKRPIDGDHERVYPTASTCANLLSLPYFGNTQRGLQLLEETLI